MDKERKFTTGTQVRLKSGGPIMTIRDYVSKDGNVQCNWFYNNEHHQETFIENQLEEYKPSAPKVRVIGNRSSKHHF